jgi:hypothetical protein
VPLYTRNPIPALFDPPLRFSQGYLSVDALRGRLSVAMPSVDRLAIAPNSRQMEILTKRVASPPIITGKS